MRGFCLRWKTLVAMTRENRDVATTDCRSVGGQTSEVTSQMPTSGPWRTSRSGEDGLIKTDYFRVARHSARFPCRANPDLPTESRF